MRNMLLHAIAEFDGPLAEYVRRIMAAQKRFLAQNYWKRGWIVQEFCLANEVHIMYGGHFLSVNDLLLCISPQPLMPSIAGPMIKDCKDGTELRPFRTKEGKRAGILNEPHSTVKSLLFAQELMKMRKFASLITLLSIGTNFETFSPHDKIYSVLGMLDENLDDLRPDYDIPIEQLYLNVATILADKDWDFLLRCAGQGYLRAIDKLPSWVPDWTSVSLLSHGIQQPVPHISQVLDEATGSVMSYYDCGFAKERPLIQPSISIVGSGLNVSGFQLAQIEALSGTIKALPKAEEQQESRLSDLVQESINGQFFNRIEAIVKPLPEQYPHANEATQEALCRTLVGNVWKTPSFADLDSSWSPVYNLPWKAMYPAPQSIVDIYNHIRNNLSNGIYAPLGIDLSGFLDGMGISRIDEGEPTSTSERLAQSKGYHWKTVNMAIPSLENKAGEEFGKMYQFLTNCFGALGGKQLARTDQGHLCLVPQFTKEGDTIVIVPGLSQPQILRRVETSAGSESPGTWVFIGSCYVHGIMNGEFWTDVDCATKDSFSII